MLTIRNEQMAVFNQESLTRFEAEMVDHLKEFGPKLYEIRGKASFRTFVQSGIAKAFEYGFSKRGPIRFILESMLAFGSEFDTDPQIPRIKLEKSGKPNPDQMALADHWFSQIDQFVKQTKGPDNRYAILALQRLRQSDVFKNDDFPFTSRSKLFVEMDVCYPEKSKYVGRTVLETLYDKASRHAEEIGLPIIEGAVILTTLMFALGHGILRDPMYPWINQTLTDPKHGDSKDRIEKLKIKSKIYLDKTLSYLKNVD